MGIQSCFPTYIYFEQLVERSLEKFNRELIEECYRIRDFDDEGREWSKTRYVGGYTSFGSLSDLHRMSSTFMDLEKKIAKHVGRFVEHLEMDLGEGSLEMTDFWLNIMPSQTTHSMHIHPLSVISGTYYVQTPKNAASIKFEDPRLDKFMAAPPKLPGAARRNKQIIECKPKAGHVVLFESWLRHEVPASITNEDRISVSFNYNWV